MTDEQIMSKIVKGDNPSHVQAINDFWNDKVDAVTALKSMGLNMAEQEKKQPVEDKQQKT